jgi:ribosomal protein S18 acetylase RimI-like enzyme
MNITRRSETADDEPFLRRLIVETITAELHARTWPQPMADQLLGVQATARLQARRPNSAQFASEVIQAEGQDAGWMVVMTLPHEVRLVEIMVSAGLRRKGIGSAAIRQVLDAAEKEGKPVRLHVNVTNTAAIRLYERLGFCKTEGDEVQHLMEIA